MRQLVIANPPVLLQLGEYFQIDAVELVTPRHSPPRHGRIMGDSEARGGMAAKGRTMGRSGVVGRACPGQPRAFYVDAKTWMPGTNPHDESFVARPQCVHGSPRRNE